jgi:hypothetical protein
MGPIMSEPRSVKERRAAAEKRWRVWLRANGGDLHGAIVK